jgi:hypothetical protein
VRQGSALMRKSKALTKRLVVESQFQRYERIAHQRRRFTLTVTLMAVWVLIVIVMEVAS